MTLVLFHFHLSSQQQQQKCKENATPFFLMMSNIDALITNARGSHFVCVSMAMVHTAPKRKFFFGLVLKYKGIDDERATLFYTCRSHTMTSGSTKLIFHWKSHIHWVGDGIHHGECVKRRIIVRFKNWHYNLVTDFNLLGAFCLWHSIGIAETAKKPQLFNSRQPIFFYS